MKIRLEISPLASTNQSGVPQYTRLLSESLLRDPRIQLYNHYFDFLNRQPKPTVTTPSSRVAINTFIPLRIYAKLQSFNIALPFDMFLPKVDLTIFPNFATWPAIRTKLKATVIHDLTYLYYPEVVEEKNLAHLRRVVPRSIQQADFIITVSESVKAELIKEFSIDPDRCIVTEIPPSTDFYKKNTNEVHQKYGIPTEKYIYFIGNLEPRKNLSTLLEAYLQLPDAIRKEYSLILAGSKGWKNEALQQALQQAEVLGENVRHIGFVDQADSPALYQKASLFVMPSLYEGFGMPVLEAMLSGCQVIASDIPVLREVGGDIATYADPNDATDFKEKILSQLQGSTSPDWQKRAKDNAARFSWEDNASKIYDITERLLTGAQN